MGAPTQIERARAAQALVGGDARRKDEDAELVAFFAIFHPDHKHRPRTRKDARRLRSDD